jgi:hypothetical protein
MRTESTTARRAAAPRLFLAAALVGVMAAVGGCPGKLDNKEQFLTNGPCDVENEIFLQRCATAACHSAKVHAQNLDLESPNVGARLVDELATECAGLLVDPAHPTESILYLKLTDSPPCGLQMPQVGQKLTPGEVNCVYEWIVDQGGSGGAGGAGGSTRGGGGGG